MNVFIIFVEGLQIKTPQVNKKAICTNFTSWNLIPKPNYFEMFA